VSDLVQHPYDVAARRSVSPLDPEIGRVVPLDADDALILSEARGEGGLPTWDDVSKRYELLSQKL
jgi:hypothetical protein